MKKFCDGCLYFPGCYVGCERYTKWFRKEMEEQMPQSPCATCRHPYPGCECEEYSRWSNKHSVVRKDKQATQASPKESWADVDKQAAPEVSCVNCARFDNHDEIKRCRYCVEMAFESGIWYSKFKREESAGEDRTV